MPVPHKVGCMRLGGPVQGYDTPEAWIAALRAAGYRAALCPVDADADAARAADIVIAEVGAWCNPLSRDDAERQAALLKCQRQLALADEIGALCCVNIAGSRGEQWDGPHPDNLTPATFDLIVETVRDIIDAVRPTRAFYTPEPMPWAYPDSVDSYLRLIAAIDRRAFGAHLDPVNWVNSPGRYYRALSRVRLVGMEPILFTLMGAAVGLPQAWLLRRYYQSRLSAELPGLPLARRPSG